MPNERRSGTQGKGEGYMERKEFIAQLQGRMKKFALDVVRFCAKLPNKPEFWVIRTQLIKSATSVAANYRSTCRAQTRAAFLAKMAIVEEEADESEFWLDMLEELKSRPNTELARLRCEAGELLGIAIQSRKTARANAPRRR